MKAYNLDTYDDDEAEDSEKEVTTDIGIFSNVKGLSYYTSNEEDPYITLKDVPPLHLAVLPKKGAFCLCTDLFSRKTHSPTTSEKNSKSFQQITSS